MKIKIQRDSETFELPYEHLKLIVEHLISRGNSPSVSRGGYPPDALGFYMTQGGWICDLSKKIDFEFIEREFDLPDSIKRDYNNDTIFCEASWIEIRGGIT